MICAPQRDTGRDCPVRFTHTDMRIADSDFEGEFWRIRTDTGALADAERNALRAYLDEKGFKTAMIDDNLAIAGELTWQEVVEPIESFYDGKADVYPF